jgi:uncharacterized membrane protein
VTVPLAATLAILYWLFQTFDNLIPLETPGLGLVLTLALVTFIGILSSNVIGRKIFDWTEQLLRRVPLVKLVYSSIKDLVGAFVGNKKTFEQPVAVRLSESSPIKALGFVTRDRAAVLGHPDHVAVYLPQSYNFAGNLILVPRNCVEPLEVGSSELMTFIVSGGISGFGQGKSVLPAQSNDSVSVSPPPPNVG